VKTKDGGKTWVNKDQGTLSIVLGTTHVTFISVIRPLTNNYRTRVIWDTKWHLELDHAREFVVWVMLND
jgi:hypothetical protein